ncbi:TPA: hypothetical protein U2K26_002761 [Legionella pneumophila]|nr:hypothetical protein [Legionella pneumophila]
MKWIKIIFKPIIWFFKNLAVPNPNYQNNINQRNNNNETKINPSTGLPMIGNLDSMGNSFGSSASDRNHNWNNDYHRQNYSYTSSYDSFTNRY